MENNQMDNMTDKELDQKDLDKVVGGFTAVSTASLKLTTAPLTFQSLKIDPRLGDKLINGACDCCKWEPAIV